MRLLRMSPKLSSFVARDSSLLGDMEYVQRNNPELAKFLVAHPEVAGNPDFYLFAEISRDGKGSRFERQDWDPWNRYQRSRVDQVLDFFVPFAVFVIMVGALLWLLRVLMENRRWNRMLKLQTDVHNKLLDKFGTSEELLAYMRSDSGKRFLEVTPGAVSLETGPRLGGAVGRILTPLQLGVVLALVGAGFYSLRGQVAEWGDAMLVMGMLSLTLGIGFIISSIISFLLARHLDLLPKATPAGGNGSDASERP